MRIDPHDLEEGPQPCELGALRARSCHELRTQLRLAPGGVTQLLQPPRATEHGFDDMPPEQWHQRIELVSAQEILALLRVHELARQAPLLLVKALDILLARRRTSVDDGPSCTPVRSAAGC